MPEIIQIQDDFQKQGLFIVDSILCTWNDLFFSRREQAKPEESIPEWKFYTSSRTVDDGKGLIVDAIFSQPSSTAPVPSALGTIIFNMCKQCNPTTMEWEWIVKYQFEGSLTTQTLIVPITRGQGDISKDAVLHKIHRQAHLLANPLKRVQQIIDSKNLEAKFHVKLLQLQDKTDFGARGGPGIPAADTTVYRPVRGV